MHGHIADVLVVAPVITHHVNVVVCRCVSPCEQGVQQRERERIHSNKPMETITEQGMEEFPSHTLVLLGWSGLPHIFGLNVVKSVLILDLHTMRVII